jgi:hypothetical protein
MIMNFKDSSPTTPYEITVSRLSPHTSTTYRGWLTILNYNNEGFQEYLDEPVTIKREVTKLSIKKAIASAITNLSKTEERSTNELARNHPITTLGLVMYNDIPDSAVKMIEGGYLTE